MVNRLPHNEMIPCPNCNFKVIKDFKYCPWCGAILVPKNRKVGKVERV